MGIFDRFRRKRNTPYYDTTNIRVHDLDVGFVFDYDLSTWEVVEIYEYDWGDNYFTREFKVTDGNQTRFLSLEEDDEVVLTLMKKIKVIALGEDVQSSLHNHQKPPVKFTYKDNEFLLDKEAPGYFHDISKGDSWEEFISWDFETQDGEATITIEQWGEQEFEASHGMFVKEFEISNILPGEQN
ncbi:MAG TPA: DUF4178 domain-containing protein [Sunxiuqinia sp.]|nr:DUF4178 domain-containing protein [Sunxiuqinia sp.]